MKFTINKTLLDSIVNQLGKTIEENHTTLAILNSVKVSANNEAIQFAASNGDDAVVINEGFINKEESDLFVEEQGEICIPSDAFKVFKKLKKGPVTFETNPEGTQVKILQNRTELVFAAFQGNEFPNLQPSSAKGELFTMPMERIIHLVNSTVHSASTGVSARPILEGLNFNLQVQQNEVLYSVCATDSHRLSFVESMKKMNPDSPISTFTLKANTMKDFCSRTFEKQKTTNQIVYIQVFENVVLFLFGDFKNGNRGNYTTIITRQLLGAFPDVKKLIPKESTETINVSIDKDELHSSLDLLSMMDGNKDTVVNLSNDIATLTSRVAAGKTSKGKQEIVLDAPVQNEIELGINTKILMESLRSIRTEKVKLQLIQPLRPVLILPIVENDEPTDFEHIELILPVRLLKNS